jgi:2-amino-4-hydroxy-6-hydroxymethyldihydropteridine diphosphokinase
VTRVSAVYVSEPVGYADQRDFWNAAAEIRWRGSPKDLLAAVKTIEARLGRRPTFPNGPREIDIDILDFDGIVSADSDPILPHPSLAARRFALAPLAEIAPGWRHPISHKTASELLEQLPARPRARRIRENL